MSREEINSSTENDRDRYLVLSIANQSFGIPLLKVKEVIGYSNPTPIPNAPSYLKGVIRLREKVLTVIDLRTKLNSNNNKIHNTEKAIILLDTELINLSIIVDAVDKVLEIKAKDFSPSIDIVSGFDMGMIKGVAKYEEELIIILEIENLLNIQDKKTISGLKQTAA